MWRVTLALAALLIPDVAMAARWEKDTVPVWGYADEFAPEILAEIDDFNTNLPPSVPRLLYVDVPDVPCDNLPEYGNNGGISICLTDIQPRTRDGLTTDGLTASKHTKGRFRRVRVAIWSGLRIDQRGLIVCHEMTHAVFDAPDNDSYPHLYESCVQGVLSHLGPWDIAYAAKVYADHHGRQRSKHRHHTHRHSVVAPSAAR